MNNSGNMSRREWFRLSIPRDDAAKNDADPADSIEPRAATVLKPIEHPPNHDGMDLAALPPMREAVLTTGQLNSLFTDIQQFATDVQLMQVSHGPRATNSRATASRVETSGQLTAAQTLLVSSRIKRLQIRYRWQDALWIDTLDRQPDGFRLVRITHRNV